MLRAGDLSHMHTKALLAAAEQTVTGTGTPVSYSDTVSQHCQILLGHTQEAVSQVRVWEPRSSSTMQDMDSWHLLPQFTPDTH